MNMKKQFGNTPQLPSSENSELINHAKKELSIAGYNIDVDIDSINSDTDYANMIAKGALELINVFSNQNHSGMSAGLVLQLFNKLVNFENLSDITSNPDEWTDVSDISREPLWQSKRNPSLFSKDGGKTWYNVNDKVVKEAKYKIIKLIESQKKKNKIKNIIMESLINEIKVVMSEFPELTKELAKSAIRDIFIQMPTRSVQKENWNGYKQFIIGNYGKKAYNNAIKELVKDKWITIQKDKIQWKKEFSPVNTNKFI